MVGADVLACKYATLDPKEIDGVLCAGIETPDLALTGGSRKRRQESCRPSLGQHRDRLPRPVEGEFNGQQKSYTVFDQFQWDVADRPRRLRAEHPRGI